MDYHFSQLGNLLELLNRTPHLLVSVFQNLSLEMLMSSETKWLAGGRGRKNSLEQGIWISFKPEISSKRVKVDNVFTGLQFDYTIHLVNGTMLALEQRGKSIVKFLLFLPPLEIPKKTGFLR